MEKGGTLWVHRQRVTVSQPYIALLCTHGTQGIPDLGFVMAELGEYR